MLKKEFPALRIGYSDHTRFSTDLLSTAWLLGAEVIEKHFTLDNSLKGNDHYHSATPDEIRTLAAHLQNLQTMVGNENPDGYDPCEDLARKYARRGVYLVRDVCCGDKLKAEDVLFARPQADGISTFEWARRLSDQERYGYDMKSGELIR
jgi:N-acetylneuraminate synthase